MAFYVAVVLDAALITFDPEHSDSAVSLVWGTSIGLALAHVFAFRLTNRLLAPEPNDHPDWHVSLAQMAGAAAVATLASLPLLFLPDAFGAQFGAGLMEFFVGVVALVVGRTRGASWRRSILFAIGVSILAGIVATLKNALVGH